MLLCTETRFQCGNEPFYFHAISEISCYLTGGSIYISRETGNIEVNLGDAITKNSRLPWVGESNVSEMLKNKRNNGNQYTTEEAAQKRHST